MPFLCCWHLGLCQSVPVSLALSVHPALGCSVVLWHVRGPAGALEAPEECEDRVLPTPSLRKTGQWQHRALPSCQQAQVTPQWLYTNSGHDRGHPGAPTACHQVQVPHWTAQGMSRQKGTVQGGAGRCQEVAESRMEESGSALLKSW